MKNPRYVSLSILTILFVIVVWSIVSSLELVRPIFLPTPGDTLHALWQLIISGRFIHALGISFARIFVATLISVILGSIIGVAMGISRKAEALISPITQPLRYLPITALIPLLVLWFGIGESMKITFLVIGVTFYIIPIVRNAIRNVPQDFLDVARSFGGSGMVLARHVYWPQALPQIFDGLIVVNGIGWTYIILAEIINASNGLGYLINIAGRLQRSDEVFAGLILVSAVAIISDRILHFIREKYLFW